MSTHYIVNNLRLTLNEYKAPTRKEKMFNKSAFVISVTLIISACGESDSPNNAITTAIGQFKDSNTAGISYISGNQSGVTGSDGSFTYETGNTITFSLGGITLGTSNGKSIITPVDLVSGSSSSTVEVQNIARFLMMLDDDGDPSNGINISPSVQTTAETWTQIDFSTTDLSTELTSIISEAVASDGGTHALPDASAAKAHLETTLLCSYAGAYTGTFTGNDNGNFGLLVDVSDGNVKGVAYSTTFDQYITLSGTTPISYDQNVTFVSGNTTSGATFDGQFTSVDAITGSWQNSPDSGSFSGSRIGGAINAAYRFTGNYTGADFGLFSFDVSNSDNVTGIAYSVAGDESFTISGSVSGTTLTASTSTGTAITGTLNTTSGDLSGTWNDSTEGLSGAFSGSGCKLN